jgi:hypothetical protein
VWASDVGESESRGVGKLSTYAKTPENLPQKNSKIGADFIASAMQENFFSVFLSLHRCRKTFSGFFYRFIGAGKLFFGFFYRFFGAGKLFFGFFYRFISAGKLFIGFFYRFIGEKNFALQNCIALFNFFLKNCASVSL